MKNHKNLKAKNTDIENRILSTIKEENPDVVVTFDKDGGSNHPDHKAVSRATTKVFKEYKSLARKHIRLYHTAMPRSFVKEFEKKGLSYNAFGKVKGVKDNEITTIININDTIDIKIKALKEHKTQHQDWERFIKRIKDAKVSNEFFKLINENNLA